MKHPITAPATDAVVARSIVKSGRHHLDEDLYAWAIEQERQLADANRMIAQLRGRLAEALETIVKLHPGPPQTPTEAEKQRSCLLPKGI
jgi:hypothetical protein